MTYPRNRRGTEGKPKEILSLRQFLTEVPFKMFFGGVGVGGVLGPERDELHEDLSGTIPTVTFQKLVKDPHNRRKTEGEPKGNENPQK